MNTIIWVIAALLVGGAIGAGLVWTFGVRRAGPLSISEMKKENERFREEVNAHFVQTAELINELTDSYKRVFDHLSDGAERLVDNEALRERMPQVGGQEVRLRHIGAPTDGGASGGATVEASAAKPAQSSFEKPEPPEKPEPSEKPGPKDGSSNSDAGRPVIGRDGEDPSSRKD